MVLFPCCKINFGLDVLRRRPDGYHDIETLMITVDGLCDVLEIAPATWGVHFTSSGAAVDCAVDNNLCVRACRLMAARYGLPGARIHLHKRIPFGAGLGGGSADAAYTVRGLNEIFSLGLSDGRMEALAAELGSDAPFFIKCGAALSTGRGEVLVPVDDPLAGMHLLVVWPGFGVSTREAYAGVEPRVPSVPLSQRAAADPRRWRAEVTNAFERSVFARYPVLEKIKAALYDSGAVYASMSGSGSALYAVYEANNASDPAFLEPYGDLFVYQQVIR